jgi:hypothetical protein
VSPSVRSGQATTHADLVLVGLGQHPRDADRQEDPAPVAAPPVGASSMRPPRLPATVDGDARGVSNATTANRSNAAMEATDTSIEVKAGFFPLGFFLFACRPRIVIDDGEPEIRSWGTHTFAVSPGRHRVRVYFHYLFKPECGRNEREVEVQQGQVVKVTYYMWPWMFAPGSMKVLAPRLALPKPAER